MRTSVCVSIQVYGIQNSSATFRGSVKKYKDLTCNTFEVSDTSRILTINMELEATDTHTSSKKKQC